MTIEQVKQNINKTVLFSNPRLHLENEKYTLVGCIIRRGEQGFFYQAELQDINQPKSIIACRLEEIESDSGSST